MENSPTPVAVVAVALRDSRGRVLLQQCPAHKRHAGKWEFPGGKVEQKEEQKVALCREVFEELGLELSPDALEPCGMAEEPPHDGRPGLVLKLYSSTAWRGNPEGREGQRWGWFTLAEAAALDLPPMDRALLEGLSG
ncbi:MAG TPA: NUDIX domain-containing protein [Croceibacterium sp.]